MLKALTLYIQKKKLLQEHKDSDKKTASQVVHTVPVQVDTISVQCYKYGKNTIDEGEDELTIYSLSCVLSDDPFGF